MAEFYDAAVSGADAIDARPGFAAMLERIEGDGVRTIIVETASRFARDLMVREVGHAKLRERGIHLIGQTIPAPSSTTRPRPNWCARCSARSPSSIRPGRSPSCAVPVSGSAVKLASARAGRVGPRSTPSSCAKPSGSAGVHRKAINDRCVMLLPSSRSLASSMARRGVFTVIRTVNAIGP